ncbi:hypothetical protein LJR225_000435 [Phenylobacterium sp. LjRoot225]|uniref:hypothetical protein n=1 Tax=Phenylobacterium sp. LjRoot225 TaxID=3342285 RepID=UPI003ED169BC
MKAFIVDRYEKKAALRLGERPEPALRDDDVLVAIHAYSIVNMSHGPTQAYLLRAHQLRAPCSLSGWLSRHA